MHQHEGVTAYIQNAAPFAQPLLRHLRALVHEACPEVSETLKWNMPFFEYHGTLCHMAAFKAHCAFGFWRGAQITGAPDIGAMGSFGRLTSLNDLPAAAQIHTWVQAAMALNTSKTAAPRPRKHAKPPLHIPAEFTALLAAHPAAAAGFAALSPSYQREYVAWISEAKAAATRERRSAKMLQQLAQGLKLNSQYALPKAARLAAAASRSA